MKNRSIALTVYIIVFFSCVWTISTKAEEESKSDFNRQINKLAYQLGYEQTYSPVYSSYSNTVMETNTTPQGEEKMVYLTFDDGPSHVTGHILDILKEHDVKATFFVMKAKDEYIPYMKRAVEDGHTIGVHTASHKYKEIYASVDAYLADFTECYNYIYEHTGVEPTIFRFPGGSVNNYNSATREDIAREMLRRGFIYFDWNVESADSGKTLPAETIYNNIISGCKGKNRAVIIMHDSATKSTTAQALGAVITQLKADGWQFAPLTNEVKPVIFKMK